MANHVAIANKPKSKVVAIRIGGNDSRRNRIGVSKRRDSRIQCEGAFRPKLRRQSTPNVDSKSQKFLRAKMQLTLRQVQAIKFSKCIQVFAAKSRPAQCVRAQAEHRCNQSFCQCSHGNSSRHQGAGSKRGATGFDERTSHGPWSNCVVEMT